MRSPKFKKFLNDKKAATAVAMAILFVPLLIAASAAVDFSRIASARTLLQASVDAAAVAGAGAYQTSQLNTAAQDVALATYSGTGLQLPKFVSSTTPTIGAYCSSQGSSTQCGTGSTDTGTLSGSCPSGWDANKEYCVVATASVTLKNSLFAWLIPSEALSATAVATTAFPPLVIGQGNFHNEALGYGSSWTSEYVSVLPRDSNGNVLYNALTTPNTDCLDPSNGTISEENSYNPFVAPATGVTNCNYLLVGENQSGGTSGSLTILETDSLTFTLVEDVDQRTASAENGSYDEDLDDNTYNSTTGTSTLNSGTNTPYTNELYVTPGTGSPSPTSCTTTAHDGTYCATGYTVPASTNYSTQTTTTTCGTWNTRTYACTTKNTPSVTTTYSTTGTVGTITGCTLNENTCTSSVTTVVAVSANYTGGAISGYCPAHSLYGVMDNYYVKDSTYTTSGSSTAYEDIVPRQDSLRTYTSAYEVLGYPPTYTDNSDPILTVGNAPLIPFLGPVNSMSFTKATSSGGSTATTSTLTYSVQAVCPQWPAPYATPTVSESFTPFGYTSADTETVAEYASYLPGAAYSDGTSDIFPPAIGGCSPVTSSTTISTASSTYPWWGWSASNAVKNDSHDSRDDCTSTTVSSTTTPTPVQGLNAQETAAYSNCPFLIQSIGTNLPTNSSGATVIPDYYSYTVVPGAFTAGTTGNPSNIVSMFPFFDEVTSGTPITYLEPAPSKGILNGTALPSAYGSVTVTVGTGSNGIASGYVKIKDSNALGFVPTSETITHSSDGSYTVLEEPGQGTDGNPPEDVSHQCLNPQANGFAAGTYSGDNNNGTAIDPVENPQLGAIQCGASPPPSYALYWKNMGPNSYPPQFDDTIEYNNVVTVFTCPTPSSTSGGGPSSLSG